jgi:hypothetical protein
MIDGIEEGAKAEAEDYRRYPWIRTAVQSRRPFSQLRLPSSIGFSSFCAHARRARPPGRHTVNHFLRLYRAPLQQTYHGIIFKHGAASALRLLLLKSHKLMPSS